MPEILPFRAWRYHKSLEKSIDELTSPLFDVVTPKQLEKLYAHDYASIHLSVPKGDNPADQAQNTLQDWKKEGIIVQDDVPSIYVYYQHFSLPGSVNEIVRKGFLANMKLSMEEPDKIYRHEATIDDQLNDRIAILHKTEMNLSPTHGFYFDQEFDLEQYMDDAMRFPIYETEDYQGVRNVMAVIQDREIIRKFITKVMGQRVILGDGHHRLKASYEYQALKQSQHGTAGNQGFNYHLMYFTNAEADDIRILATHRLITGMAHFNEDDLINQLSEKFHIKSIDDAFTLEEVIRGKRWTFGLLLKNNAYRLKLKPEIAENDLPPGPQILSELDISIAHYHLLDELGGEITYDRSFSDCYARILQGEVQMALIINEIDMAKVKEVCYSGHSLPAKSTYFYPKVISGFVFSSINENEFRFPSNISF